MALGVIKEWKCLYHGSFEGSHPICPHYGCLSDWVEREFRTAPKIGTGAVRRTDASLRDVTEGLRIHNVGGAKAEGDVSFAGRAAEDSDFLSKGQTKLLWGDAEVARVMGKQTAQMVAEAARPLDVPGKLASDPYVRVNNGMRSTANTTPIFNRPLPPAEVRRDPRESGGPLVQVQT